LYQEDELCTQTNVMWKLDNRMRPIHLNAKQDFPHLLISYTTSTKTELGFLVRRGGGADALRELCHDLWRQPTARCCALRHPVVSYSVLIDAFLC
jgi:hypothetical protein